MRFGHTYPPPALIRFSNIARLTTSGNVLKAIANPNTGRGQVAYADGDKLFAYFYLDGSETLLEITTNKNADRGIWDLYINGTLDSSGYDDYAASASDIHREITLAVPVIAGANTVEIRVNGKNISSTNYAIRVGGMSFQ